MALDAARPLLVDGVSVELGGTVVLRDISFSAESGCLTAVVGPNGAGKSTLMNTIVGLVTPKAGRVAVFGRAMGQVRGRVAYVPQRERVNWRFPVTVQDVVLMGRCNHIGLLRRPGRNDRFAVAGALERVGMAGIATAPMEELSGGQRQRVFLARAIAQDAQLLLFDEALSAIDIGAQEAIFRILRDVCGEGKTVLLSTHDLAGVARRCDMCLCLNCHVCAYGPPATVLTTEVMQELYATHDPALLPKMTEWTS